MNHFFLGGFFQLSVLRILFRIVIAPTLLYSAHLSLVVIIQCPSTAKIYLGKTYQVGWTPDN